MRICELMLRNYHVIIAAESAQLPRAQSKSVCLKQPTMPTEDFKESTWLMVSYSVNTIVELVDHIPNF